MIKLVKSTFYKEKETKKILSKFILNSQKLSFGVECEKFEKKFAKWQGRKYCIVLNSGSSANLAIIQTLLNLGRIKRDDEVGFSSITWATNVMPLIQLGLKAVPVDIELETLNVSSKNLNKVIKKHKLKALFLTNLLGFCSDIDEIKRICKREKILLIEDNCESPGTIYKGEKLGNFSVASTVSFYVGHHLSTIEGGAVVTDDEEMATMLKIVRAHGWDRNLAFSKRREMRQKFQINSEFYSRYTFYDLGFNLRPTEICGFIGSFQLNFFDEIIEKRQKNFFKMAGPIYQRSDLYYPIKFDHIDLVSNFAFPVVCKTQKIKTELIRRCKGKIEIRPVVGGDMTKQPFFAKYLKNPTNSSTNAKFVHDNGLYFGNNPELTAREMETIISIFTSF